jgi:2,3-bisphosphoglycerate-independent phosphoglycerate mutase
VKYGHVTYYFNGNSYDKAPLEEFEEVESYVEPFETRPWMRCAEITDTVIREMPNYRFVRVNYPGGDMVGHTANMEATIVAMESIDLSLARLAAKVDELGGCLIIVADHGNAEELLDAEGRPKTAHTTNKVPCIIYDKTKNRELYQLADVVNPGLANLAATVATLLGLDDYPEQWSQALIKLK